MNRLELKIPPPILALLAAALMWLLSLAAPALGWGPMHTRWLAPWLFLAGGLVAVLGVLAFKRARTTVDPRTPARASSLVNAGIYQFSRNPMYLGLLMALSSWAAFLANGLALLVLPAFVIYMNRFQIGPEERALQQRFGQEFSSYTQRVRRWI